MSNPISGTSLNTISNMNNTSPLRYPGGKTRACDKLDKVLKQYFDIKNIKGIMSLKHPLGC